MPNTPPAPAPKLPARLGDLPRFLTRPEFERLADAEEGRLSVELTTAFELDDAEARSIVEQIQSASGRTVEATRAVDPSLIGGIVIQAGTKRVDASIRGRLERLSRELATRA